MNNKYKLVKNHTKINSEIHKHIITAFDFEKLDNFSSQYLTGVLFQSLDDKKLKYFTTEDLVLNEKDFNDVLLKYSFQLKAPLDRNMETAYTQLGKHEGILEESVKLDYFEFIKYKPQEKKFKIKPTQKLLEELVKHNYIQKVN